MHKALIWIGGIFFAFGLVFTGVAGWSYFDDLELAENGETARGTVIDLSSSRDSDGDTTYRPIVKFEDRNGTTHQFTSSVGSSPPAFTRGEQVDVIYDPWAPEDAMIDSFTTRYLLPLAFGAFGFVFGGIGAGMLGIVVLRRRTIARLKQSGLPIEAKFIECFRDTSTKVNGRSPWKVVAQARHPASGKLQDFESDAIWVDLTSELAGKRVTVLVDPQKPKAYYVDLSEWLHDEEPG